MEEILANGWNALVGAWGVLWDGLENFMNPSMFLTSLLVLILATFILPKVNTLLKYIVLAFIGAAVYFLLLSIDVIGQSRAGASIAFIVAAVAILARIGIVWRGSGRPGQLFTVLAVIGIIVAMVPVLGSINPDLPVGGAVSDVLERTGSFVNTLFRNSAAGAETVQ